MKMDVRVWESVAALIPGSRLLLVFGVFNHFVTLFANASHPDRSEEDESDEDRELCERQCTNGCCENLQCCEPHTDMPSFTVQVIAAVGSCAVMLLLLCLCIVRYRMASRMRRVTERHFHPGTTRARRSNASVATGSSCTSVCSRVSGPHSPFCPWDPQSVFIMGLLEDSGLPTPLQRPGGQIVTPPPYSECDPHGVVLAGPGQPLPPPYDEVVKESENVTAPAPSSSSSS